MHELAVLITFRHEIGVIRLQIIRRAFHAQAVAVQYIVEAAEAVISQSDIRADSIDQFRLVPRRGMMYGSFHRYSLTIRFGRSDASLNEVAALGGKIREMNQYDGII
jgi:hypothetical protein